MTFTAGETGLIFYRVNHLTQPVKSYIFSWIWSLEHRFYQLAIFNAHLRAPVFIFPSLTFSPQDWSGVLISLIIWNKEINIVFSLTAVHRHTHICVISPLLLHSLIRTLMLLKLLASYVGLRNSTYCWLWKMLGTVNWSVTAVAGVCGGPVQVVPVGPVWNSLIYVCSIYLFVLFTQCLRFSSL